MVSTEKHLEILSRDYPNADWEAVHQVSESLAKAWKAWYAAGASPKGFYASQIASQTRKMYVALGEPQPESFEKAKDEAGEWAKYMLDVVYNPNSEEEDK